MAKMRIAPPFSLLSVLALTGCYEEQVGPQLDTPQPITNECLELTALQEEPVTDDTLLEVFDCLNSEGAFQPLRAPVAYLVDRGYLAPYFTPDYLATFNVQDYMSGGDLQLTVQSLNALLSDPDEPLKALQEVYLDFWYQGHLASVMQLTQDYSAYLYSGVEDGPEASQFYGLMELAEELYYSDALAVLKAELANAPEMDASLSEDLQADAMEIARQITADASPTGENMALALGASFINMPLQDDPDRNVDDVYAANQWTVLRALQQPLCQLRSDRDTIDAFLALAGQQSASGQTDYLPLYLRTLANVNPSGEVKTFSLPTTDNDNDGYTIAQGDCNDANNLIFPKQTETTDGIDNNCDLVADVKPGSTDADGDGVTPAQGDCNDTDASIHPFVRIYGSNGSISVVEAAAEFGPNGEPDFKDNDCDGFADYVPSSLELLFSTAGVFLPMVYAENSEGVSNLLFGLETAMNQSSTTVDLEALLASLQSTIDSFLYNYNNGTLSPELTAQMRVVFPVVEVLADLGMLSTSSTDALVALYADHQAYVTAYEQASETEKQNFEKYKNACGEEFDQYVDTVKVLEELVRIVDAYQLPADQNLQALIPIVVNSDLLLDMTKAPSNPALTDPEVVNALLWLFDYFMAPPDGSGLFADQYDQARLWKLMPLADVLFDSPVHLDTLDSLMVYGLDGILDPNSPLSGLPDAMAALATVQTGGTVDQEGLIQLLLSEENRVILLNMLAIPADEDFTNLLLGNWDALSPSAQPYVENISTFQFLANWMEEGILDRFIDMAGTLLDWIVDNTGLGDPISSTDSTTETK
ncbi:MAG: putative metal-binding motif-containing protein [Myxococcota bacterium]